MHPDEEAFLRAVCAAPDDDLPRLIYADWLDERGDPRGEFIRVECALAHLASDDPRRPPLHRRDCELIKLYKEQWVGDIPELAKRRMVGFWDFRRGMLEVLTIDAIAFVGISAAYVRHMPISQLVIWNIRDYQVDRMAANPVLYRVRDLTLSTARQHNSPQGQPQLGPPALVSILGATNPSKLTVLRVNARIGDSGVSALARWPGLTSLRRLALTGNEIGNEGARLLAHVLARGRIESLDLTNNPITSTGLQPLRDQFGERVKLPHPNSSRRRRRTSMD